MCLTASKNLIKACLIIWFMISRLQIFLHKTTCQNFLKLHKHVHHQLCDLVGKKQCYSKTKCGSYGENNAIKSYKSTFQDYSVEVKDLSSILKFHVFKELHKSM